VPGYSRLLLPIAWLLIGAMLTAAVAYVEYAQEQPFAVSVGLGILTVVGWVVLLVSLIPARVARHGVLLSTGAHVLLGTYLFALAGLVMGVVNVFRSSTRMEAVVWLIVAGGSTVLLPLCRRAERFIAEQCIRGHLRRRLGAK
jgi:hypothetical protein